MTCVNCHGASHSRAEFHTRARQCARRDTEAGGFADTQTVKITSLLLSFSSPASEPAAGMGNGMLEEMGEAGCEGRMFRFKLSDLSSRVRWPVVLAYFLTL